MSTNQYRGREETDKRDFSKIKPEEQQEISERNISHEQNEAPINEGIAQREADKLDKERARRVQ